MNRPIGFFDSGVGGLSVLREAVALLPYEDFVYYGDDAHAPYGEKTLEEIISLSFAAVDRLLAYDIKALVVACNTATSAAVTLLRERLIIPVIGMEPALKPAQAIRKQGKILVMATPATLSLPKFQSLMQQYGQGAVPLAVHGLVDYVQRGEISGERLQAFLHNLLAPYLEEQVDGIVLGCTHYVFVREPIATVVGPTVALLDGNRGTVLRLQDRLIEYGLLQEVGRPPSGKVDPVAPKVVLLTSADQRIMLPMMQRLLFL